MALTPLMIVCCVPIYLMTLCNYKYNLCVVPPLIFPYVSLLSLSFRLWFVVGSGAKVFHFDDEAYGVVKASRFDEG